MFVCECIIVIIVLSSSFVNFDAMHLVLNWRIKLKSMFVCLVWLIFRNATDEGEICKIVVG